MFTRFQLSKRPNGYTSRRCPQFWGVWSLAVGGYAGIEMVNPVHHARQERLNGPDI